MGEVDLAAHRGGAPQLALPARPPHRRLRRHRPPLPRRRVAAWRARALDPDVQAFRDAGRVGAARGHLARLAAQPLRLAGALRADPLGLRRDRAQARRGRDRADPGAVEGARGEGAPDPRARRAPTSRASSSSASPPTAAGRATSGPIFVQARAPEARGGGRALPLQRLGQVPRPQEGRPGRRSARRRRSALRAAPVRCTRAGRSCSRAARIDVNGRGTLLTTEECLLDPVVQVRNPGFTRADYEQVFRESARGDAT